MKSLVVSAPDARARRVEFIPDALVVHLEDGRSLTVPLMSLVKVGYRRRPRGIGLFSVTLIREIH